MGRPRFQVPDLPHDRPTVLDVVPLIRALYRRHGAGCCWHVVLDDGNYDSVSWVVNSYLPTSDCREPECRQLAELLPKMTKTQLRKANRVAHTKGATARGGSDSGR